MNTPDDFPTTPARNLQVSHPAAPSLEAAFRSGSLRIDAGGEGDFALAVRDVSGRTVADRTGKGQAAFALDRETLQPGLHLVELRRGGAVSRRSVMVP